MNIPELFSLGLIALAGFFCQWLAWRTNLPAILFLLVSGMLLGPVSGVIVPDELFGEFLFPLISVAVSIILFEGSLTLKRSELKEIGSTVINMVSYGALINMVITTIATHYLTGLNWSLSALFGAIMVVTGPTVIVPMLRAVRPNAKISRTLRWEGIIIDPLGALFAVIIFEWIVAQQSGSDWLDVLKIFSETVLVGAVLGFATAHCLGLLLRHHWIPEYLHNFAAIGFVIGTFALADTLMHESGLLAVTIMGIYLTNMPGVHIRHILHFKENLTLLLVSGLFIILSARIDFAALMYLGWGAVGVLLVMQFIARPAKVFISTLGSSFTPKERLLLAWIGPRGIVAAAVSVAFALKLEYLNIADAELLVPLAFSIIIGTVVIQGTTAKALASKLEVNQSGTQGFLLIGANPVARAIAVSLKNIDVPSILCDTDWENISQARMQGLETYYGNPVSDHAEVHIDLSGIGGMLGLSHYYSYNTTAALRFREDFGNQNIFSLITGTGRKSHDKHRISDFYKGSILFGEDISYIDLHEKINQGWEIKNTQLSDEYTMENWQQDNNAAIILFVLDDKQKLHWLTKEKPLKYKKGYRLFALSEK